LSFNTHFEINLYIYIYLRCKANDEYAETRVASEGNHTVFGFLSFDSV